MPLSSSQIQDLAHACGFEIAGVTPAAPHPDYERFLAWTESGNAAGLEYLTDRRGVMRSNPQSLLPNAQSIICLGKLYNTGPPILYRKFKPERGLDFPLRLGT